MIKATELRIGSWVRHKRSDDDFYRDYLIAGIDLSNNGFIIAILENGSDFYRMAGHDDGDLQPIPLTPEILERCGFDGEANLDFKGDLSGQTLHIHSLGIAYLYGQDSCTAGQAFTFNCKYLHQLQNLYFALTGEELEIKELQHA